MYVFNILVAGEIGMRILPL